MRLQRNRNTDRRRQPAFLSVPRRAFIVALAGAAVAVLEQAMGLQPAERPGPLPRAVRQDARHQTLVVVVENRLGNPAAEGKGRIVPVQPSLRRRRRVGRNKAGIAVRKRYDERQ